MDGSRFDDLTRMIATASSRRRFLGGLLGTVGVALGATAARAAPTCPSEQIYRRGIGCACRATGRPPTNGGCPCPTGQTSCPAGCVDTTLDPANCGGCGETCPADLPFCRDGRCLQCLQDTDCPLGGTCLRRVGNLFGRCFCQFLGTACGSDAECCDQVVGGITYQVACSPSGFCGFYGAACSEDSSCFPLLACGVDGTCGGGGAVCAENGNCTSGQCCPLAGGPACCPVDSTCVLDGQGNYACV
jgi:hypothetical protein